MKAHFSRFLAVVVAMAGMVVSSSQALAQEEFPNCELQDTVDDQSEGRFIFKQTGAHFSSNSVIVVPRCYYDGSSGGSPVNIFLYNSDGTIKLERARLKSTGNCAGHPECLFASTYLTRKNGKFYKRRYGSILVRISPRKGVTGLRCNYCSYYRIQNPAKRIAIRPPVVVSR